MQEFKRKKRLPAAMAALTMIGCISETYGNSEGFSLEEVIVTARKRDESLQEVPESVTVLSEMTIEDAGIDNLQGIADIAPNIHMNDSFSKATIRLSVRGIGTAQAGEAPVSFVVDGATVPDVTFINQGIFDVESIQLLRGPQGALYGQGALAGAMLIQSKQPSNEYSGKVEIKHAKGNDKTINAAISGPLIEDKLLFRVGANYHDKEGLIKNVEGEDQDFVDSAYGIRAMLKYIASDDLELKFTAKRADGDYGYGIQYRIDGMNLNDEDTFDTALINYPGVETQETEEYTFQADWDLGFAALTAVTNYSDLSDYFWGEWDSTPTATEIQLVFNDVKGWSQELRLTSNDDQAFRWIIGGAYRNRTIDYLVGFKDDDGNDTRFALNRNDPDVRDDSTTKSKDFGVYAFASYDLTDKLELTGALRYDKTQRDISYSYGFNDDIVGSDSADFSELQPKLGASYQVTEDILTYANYSRGFRTGAFNHPNYVLSPGRYDSELSDSFEIGAKTAWLDNRLILNSAVYLLNVDGYQFTEFSGTIGNANIEDADIKGLEVELMAKPTENLTINMAYGYTDADLVKFSETPSTRDDNKIPFVPHYTFNFSIAHDMNVTDNVGLRSYLSYRRSGATYHRADNQGKIDAQHYWDAKLTLNVGENWRVSGFIDNILDYRSAVHFFLPPSIAVVTPNAPRSYGVSFKYEF